MLKILWGSDTFSRAEALAALKRGLDPDGMLSSNTTMFDGGHLDFDALVAVSDTVPFLAAHRLVIVENLLGQPQQARRSAPRRPRSAGAAQPPIVERLLEYLPRMADTTTLVLLEDNLTANSAALTSLREFGEAVYFGRKSEPELRAWVTARARMVGAEIDPPAVALLVESTRGDLWSLVAELEKLALFASGRAITAADVQELVPAAQEANVFGMLDALADGKLNAALIQLDRLLGHGAAVAYLLTMMARQVRLLIIAEDMLRAHQPADAIARAVDMRADTPAMRRLLQQARRADPSQLLQRLDAIAATDAAIKRGEIDEQTAIYALASELGGAEIAPFRYAGATAPGQP